METTPELIIFFIVGGIAILAAVMMLISENAVHSALFLVLNFACVAFLYLMLDAAFLTMIQVSVYAGAIMVLFMFVIMLLGAEQVSPESKPRFPWLTPAAIVLTMVFLLTAGIGILEADISASAPKPTPPIVRVINAAPSTEALDVALNGELLAGEVTFRESSRMVEWAAGEYSVHISTEAEAIPLADSIITLENGQTLTLVIVEQADGSYGMIRVQQDMNPIERNRTANVQLVNAFDGSGAIALANITEADRAPQIIFEDVPFGAASAVAIKRDNVSRFAVYAAGAVEAARAAKGDSLKVVDVQAIATYEEEKFTANTSALYILAKPPQSGLSGQQPDLLLFADANRARFGSPTSVGQLLFTRYMLPFQVIALLLLAAMVGAIVLTRDQVPLARKRFPRRLAMTDEEE